MNVEIPAEVILKAAEMVKGLGELPVEKLMVRIDVKKNIVIVYR